ncbi:MAG: hypothetical protein MSS98_01480 [Alphaproteobacteria bacterium]|nr:hypothetical protein [Alphaproteobacteria bacterium]MDY4689449.1 hypothetical protein [Alphaproteobacteria bacterium]
MRRILFAVSLIAVLSQAENAAAEDVYNWADFLTEAAEGDKTINLKDNLEVPAGYNRLQINGSAANRRYFSIDGNSHSIIGTNTDESQFFWSFDRAVSTIKNLTIQDFRSSVNSGDFGGIKLQRSDLKLNNVNVQNFSNPSGGAKEIYGGVFDVSDGSVMRIEYAHLLNNKQHADSAVNGDAMGGVLYVQGLMRGQKSWIDYLKFSYITNNAIISENKANAYGGAIFLEGYMDTFSGNTFSNNTAQAIMDGTSAYGGAVSLGGVFCDRGTAYITYFGRDPLADMEFTSNKAIADGNGGEAAGGAFFVSEYGKTDFNKADESWMFFSGNIAQADKGTAKGGAIANYYKADSSVNMYALEL